MKGTFTPKLSNMLAHHKKRGGADCCRPLVEICEFNLLLARDTDRIAGDHHFDTSVLLTAGRGIVARHGA